MHIQSLSRVLVSTVAFVALITTSALADERSESTGPCQKTSLLSIKPFHLPSGLLDEERVLLNAARHAVNILPKVANVDDAIKETRGIPKSIWSELDENAVFDTILIEFDTTLFNDPNQVNVFFVSEKGGFAIELRRYNYLQEMLENNLEPDDDWTQPTEPVFCVNQIRFFTFGSKECFYAFFYANSARVSSIEHGDYRIEQTTPCKGRDYVSSSKDYVRLLVDECDARVFYYQKGRDCNWNRSGNVVSDKTLDSPVLKSTRDDWLRLLDD